MILVILYGPPASGKLTVGTELAKLTGFKLFHNHLIGNVARDLYEFGTPGYQQLKHELWHTAFRVTARQGLAGMIFTFMYEGPRDDVYLVDLFGVLREASIEYRLVRLKCEPAELRHRLGNESRVVHRKLTDTARFDDLTMRSDFDTDIPFDSSFVVDTTTTPPAQSAEMIQAQYQLPLSGE